MKITESGTAAMVKNLRAEGQHSRADYVELMQEVHSKMYRALKQARCSMLDSGYSKCGVVILAVDDALSNARGEK